MILSRAFSNLSIKKQLEDELVGMREKAKIIMDFENNNQKNDGKKF